VNADGHRKKADELMHAIRKLAAEPEEDVVATVELAFGLCHHLVACGMERRLGRHIDTHAGVSRVLREEGATDIANAFELLGTLRQGRFYGGKGDGPTVQKTLEIIETVQRWVDK
jgi:hypothetical protein